MDVLSLTRELIGFRTINPPGDEAPCVRHLGTLLEADGFTVASYEFAPGRPSLVARLGGRADTAPLCFIGHVDTVPLGTRPWMCDAFSGETRGDRLFGRGASDMKGGLAAFVVAAHRLARRLPGTPGLVLVITAGEETGCQGAMHLAAQAHALGRAGAIVVAEPTGNQPFVGHKGALWLKARAGGVTAHASMPERGVNAIYKAARAVTRLETYRFDVAPHPILGAPTQNVGTIHGGLNVNSVPDAAVIGIDVRTIPEQKHVAVRDALADHLGDDVAVEVGGGAEALWSDPEHPWVQEVFDVLTPVLGARPAVAGAPYFTDASALTPAYGGVPTLILGPGELEMAHQTDEYCLMSRLHHAVDVYEEIARRWCRL